ncbi:MAG: nitrate ABC transporter permease [Nitrospirae bacterium]|nr:nitrate ABC transporter permease [Nitrospirota bacterium]
MERVRAELLLPLKEEGRTNAERPKGPPLERIGPHPWVQTLDALIMPLTGFLALVGLWALLSATVAPSLPSPAQTLAKNWELIRQPFYDRGPNNKGIGWQLLYSLGRVGLGFALAALVGIPAGLLLGLSSGLRKMWDPVVQLLRPVSPLAWLPLGLATFQAANPAAIFTIFITALWPILLNTSAGVQQVPKEYLHVGRILKLSRRKMMIKILLPAALPHILSGLRVGLGVAWLVIVASEMLTGGVGIGFFVWDEWNNLSLEHIILAIVVIGLIGLALDRLMLWAARTLSYQPTRD